MIQHNQLNLIQTSSVFPPSLSAPGSNPGNCTVLSCHVCLASSDLWQLLRPLLTHVKTAQLSCSVVSDSLWPHEPQHVGAPCPSPSPGVHAARQASLPITKSRSPRSMPGLPVHHQLPESTQTHVHRASDATQPSHPLSSPSPPALNLSQHQGLFKWVSSRHQVVKVLGFQLQHQSFQWTPRTDLL